MSLGREDAQDAAAKSLFEAITEAVEAVKEDPQADNRIPRLSTLADAYAAVAFGARKG